MFPCAGMNLLDRQIFKGVPMDQPTRRHGPPGSPEWLRNTLCLDTDALPLRRIGNRQPIRADHRAGLSIANTPRHDIGMRVVPCEQLPHFVNIVRNPITRPPVHVRFLHSNIPLGRVALHVDGTQRETIVTQSFLWDSYGPMPPIP